jgi:hypothetical protein
VDSTKPFNATTWNAILQTGVERYLSDDMDRFGKPLPLPSLHDEWLTDSEKRLDTKHDRSSSQREPLHEVPDLLLPELQREPAPQIPTRETTRVPRSSQRELDRNTNSGGVHGNRDSTRPRPDYGDRDSAQPIPEPPPATPTRLELDDEPDPLP